MILGVISDDLTGGVEVAAMLVAAGIPTSLTIGLEGPLDGKSVAHVIALKSRVAPVDVAVSDVVAAATMLLEAGYPRLFFKYCATFDSRDDGNIGPCAEALMDLLGADQTLFCPAYHAVDRTVYRGHMFCDDQLLGESPKALDPLTPMTDSNLVRVLQKQSRKRASLIDYTYVRRGPRAIAERMTTLNQSGYPLLLTDTLFEEDLEAIAEVAADLPLMTGNSSVAAHLPKAWRRRGMNTGNSGSLELPGIEGNGLVLSGSCAQRTIDQLEHFAINHPVHRVDLDAMLVGDDVVSAACDWARARIDGGPVAIATSEPQVEAAARHKKHSVEKVSLEAERVLAAIGKRLVDEANVQRILVAGGETSGSVLSALGIRHLQIGPYRNPGLSYVYTEQPQRLSLVVKSGKLGAIDMMVSALEEMRPKSTPDRRAVAR